MRSTLLKSLDFLSSKERGRLAAFALLRIFAGLLDLIAISLVGLILKITSSDGYWSDLAPSIQSYVSFNVSFENFMIALSVVTLVLFVGKSVLSAKLSKITSLEIAKNETRITSSLLLKIVNIKNVNFSQYSTHEFQNSLVLSATSAFTYLLSFAINLVTESFLLVAIFVLFVFIDPFVSVALIVYFGAVGILIQMKLGDQLRNSGETLNASIVKSQEKVSDILSVRSEICFMDTQEKFVKSFQQSRQALSSSNGTLMYLNSLPRYIIEASMLVGVALLTIYVFMSNDPSEAATTIGIFLAGSLRIMASSLPMQTAISSIKQHSKQAELFYKIASEFKSTINDSSIESPAKIHESKLDTVRLNNLTKTYEGKFDNALEDVSVTIDAPSFTALIGPSGSGKSTLVEILLGVIEPTSGKVEFLDSNGEQIFPSQLKLGYVPQAPKLIHGTLLNNLLLSPDAESEFSANLDIVIKQAQLEDLIASLPNGLSTNISPQGNNFSGGQIQRIGIARALLNDPDVLVLDEATSALDAVTESEISKILLQISRQTLVITIAHRMATIESADKVIFLSEGRVTAVGTLADLAKSEPLVNRYIQLIRMKGLHN